MLCHRIPKQSNFVSWVGLGHYSTERCFLAPLGGIGGGGSVLCIYLIYLIIRVVKKMRREAAWFILIASFWPSQAWFWTLLDLAHRCFIFFPEVKKLISTGKMMHHDQSRLCLTAWLIGIGAKFGVLLNA